MKPTKYCLGLEGSANKLGVAIITFNGDILSNLRSTYNAPAGQGFLPPEVTRHHRSNIIRLINQALSESKIGIKDLNLIAYTQGPGIGGPLSAVGLVARTLSLLHDIPLAPVNHCVAHIEMGRLVTGIWNPVVLYASGGNTQVIAFGHGRYRIFGEALDIAVGNCLDRVARLLNLSNDPSPGQNIEALATAYEQYFVKVNQIPELILDIPVAVKGMDVSCSGAVTWLQRFIQGADLDKEIIQGASLTIRNKICYSLQEHIFSALTEVTERAAAFTGAKEVLCVGGVGCNVKLQQKLQMMVDDRGGKVGAMDQRYCIDNGAMIGWCGIISQERGWRGVQQRFRTDQVQVTWRNE